MIRQRHGFIENTKLKAFTLRRKNASYAEIAKLLNIQKSTIAYWFKNIDWSKDIKLQLTKKAEEVSKKRLIHLNNLKKEKFSKLYNNADREAIREFYIHKSEPLFLAGIMIYWGEGDRVFKNGQVRVSNIDPNMLYIFNKFLQRFSNITPERIRAYILIYPDLEPIACLRFWSKHIEIPIERFCKPTVIQGNHKKNRLNYGICTVQLSNKYFKKKLLRWIELFSKEFRS